MTTIDTPSTTGEIARSFPIDDLVVRSDGDGRTVEAYAAVFGTPAEIDDFDGHYWEVIDRAAFNGVIARNVLPPVFFNHGRDMFGFPSDKWSAPIGRASSITADARGLRTVSRISETPNGDEALELMRDGAIDGFSFSGKPNRSKKEPARSGDDLPTIIRQDLTLREYGPAVFRAYDDARIVAMRTEQFADRLTVASPEELTELLDVLRSRMTDPADPARSVSVDDDDTARILAAGAPTMQERRRLAARIKGLI